MNLFFVGFVNEWREAAWMNIDVNMMYINVWNTMFVMEK